MNVLLRRLVLSKIRCFCDVAGLDYEIKEYRNLLSSYCVVSVLGDDRLLLHFEKFIIRLKWLFSWTTWTLELIRPLLGKVKEMFSAYIINPAVLIGQ